MTDKDVKITCNRCGAYVGLRDLYSHMSRCDGTLNKSVPAEPVSAIGDPVFNIVEDKIKELNTKLNRLLEWTYNRQSSDCKEECEWCIGHAVSKVSDMKFGKVNRDALWRVDAENKQIVVDFVSFDFPNINFHPEFKVNIKYCPKCGIKL